MVGQQGGRRRSSRLLRGCLRDGHTALQQSLHELNVLLRPLLHLLGMLPLLCVKLGSLRVGHLPKRTHLS